MDGDVVEKPAGIVMKIEGRIGGLSQIRSQIRAELEFGRKFLGCLEYLKQVVPQCWKISAHLSKIALATKVSTAASLQKKHSWNLGKNIT